jgi:uncharacterized ferritin-like protein (DUF455 family)
MATIGYFQARGDVRLRISPAREPCFTVVTDQADMSHFDDETPDAQREQLHSSVNEEIQSLEIAAQSIVDFPETPWAIRVNLARQCWDETRHARLFLGRLLAKGGWKGEFPIINQEWGVVSSLGSLPARLAVQNRLFEGGSLDVLHESIATWRRVGDEETAEVVDGVLADEVDHSAFANDWLRRLGREDPRGFLAAVSAMSQLPRLVAALTPPEQHMDHIIPANREDRHHAGFSV